MKELRIMVVGAHPDDCDFSFGAAAAKYIRLGHKVRFLSMTNGCSGHHETPGVAMTARRWLETRKVEEVSGIEYHVLDIPDAFLTTDLRYREMLISEIRAYKPDAIFTHRSCDYHPDHRNTGLLVQDASYLLMVPHVVPDSPALRYNPYIFYLSDNFQQPIPFQPDMVVDIDDAMDELYDIAHCHTSQVYEWLPWVSGILDTVPPAEDEAGRREWLKGFIGTRFLSTAEKYRDMLCARYGQEKGAQVQRALAFQLCEYGGKPDEVALRELFPF